MKFDFGSLAVSYSNANKKMLSDLYLGRVAV
jgi:hypothetical protein